MRRLTLLVAVLAAVVLAGCVGGTAPGGGADTSPDSVPGVTDGRLSNATALAGANEAALARNGSVVAVNRSVGGSQFGYRLRIGPGAGTYALSGSRVTSAGGTVDLALYRNASTRLVRTDDGSGPTYRASDPEGGRLDELTRVEPHLAAGNFTVVNATADRVVLEADEPAAVDDRALEGATAVNGRLVVDGSGLIHELDVTAETPEGTHTYRYELIDPAAGDPEPAWLGEVPAGATLRPELTVDADGSYLTLRNTGGDPVPSGAVLELETNGTGYGATFGAPLEPGDQRYVYVADGSLRTAASPPGEGVAALASPVSVNVRTAGGTDLYSASLAWASEGAGEGAEGSGGSGGSGSTGGEAAEG